MRFDRNEPWQGYTVRATLGTAPSAAGFHGCLDSFLRSVTVDCAFTVRKVQWQGAIGSIKFDEIAGLLAAERNNVGRVLVSAEKSRVVPKIRLSRERTGFPMGWLRLVPAL
jgi:hypothetical protein